MENNVTLADYAAHYLTTRAARLKPRTVETYRSTLDRFILPALGAVPLGTLTRPVMRTLIASLAGRYRPQTVRGVATVLGTMCAAAVDDGVLAESSASRLTRGLVRFEAPEPKALDAVELAAVLAATRGMPQHDVFALLALTGLRLGEALGLQSADVDLRGATLTVQRTWHGTRLGTGDPKTHTSRRRVDLAPSAVVLLARCVEQAIAEPGWLFPSDRRPIRPWARNTCAQRFRAAADAARLPRSVTAHCLRHTYATLLLEAGASPQYVQQQLGHRSISITLDLYGCGARLSAPAALGVLDQAVRQGVGGVRLVETRHLATLGGLRAHEPKGHRVRLVRAGMRRTT